MGVKEIKDTDGLDKRIDALEKSIEERLTSFRNEMRAELTSFRNEMRSEFATLHSEIRRIDQVTDLRERLASVEAKLAAQVSRKISDQRP